VALDTGTRLGPYEILGPLGSGGMGEVYRARDTRLDRVVAVKVLPADARSPNALERFEREAKAIAALNHPGICAIHDVGTEPVPYLVMELLEGESLHQRLARGPLDVPALVDTGLALADALAAAHAKGILHRDLKPANIVLTPRGPKILDFGLARGVEAAAEAGAPATAYETLSAHSPLTDAGVTVGTVAYMSPEQLRGESLDARTDLFSLGLVLYETATGRRAFAGGTSAVTSAAILHEQPTAPRQIRADLPARLEQAILTLLEKDRDVRTQTASELRAELTRIKREMSGGRAVEPASSVPADGIGAAVPSGASSSGAAPGSAVSTPPPSSSDAQLVAGLIGRHRGTLAALAAVFVIVAGTAWFLTRTGPGGPAAGTGAPLSIADLSIDRLTTSGTAASSAISPEGNYVAYVEQGGYAASLRVRQIATGSNVEIVPAEAGVGLGGLAVTPDGNFVTYVRTVPSEPAELWQVPFLGGSPRRLLRNIGSPASFSPDGTRMAYVRGTEGGGSEVVVSALDGSDAQVLAARRLPEGFLGLHFTGFFGAVSWSPDGATLAALGARGGGATEPDTGQVVFVDAQTGISRAVNAGPPLVGVGLDWLDQRSLVLSMLVRSSAPMQLWQLTYPDGEFSPLSNDLNQYVGVSLTADRDTLVTVRSEYTFDISTSDASATTWTQAVPDTPMKGPVGFGVEWLGEDLIYPASTSGGFALMRWNPTTRTAAVLAQSGGQPSVSRDGTVVYFEYDAAELWGMDAAGENRNRIRGGFGALARVTPDGRSITRFDLTRADGPAVVIEPIDGSDGRVIATASVTDGKVEVSPDGRLVAFTALDEADRPVLTVCDLETCSSRRTLPSLLRWRWTPDSQGLAYVDPVTQTDLWIQPIDGGAPRRLTQFEDDARVIADFAWSADGSRLAVARATQTNDIILFRGLQGPD